MTIFEVPSLNNLNVRVICYLFFVDNHLQFVCVFCLLLSLSMTQAVPMSTIELHCMCVRLFFLSIMLARNSEWRRRRRKKPSYHLAVFVFVNCNEIKRERDKQTESVKTIPTFCGSVKLAMNRSP